MSIKPNPPINLDIWGKQHNRLHRLYEKKLFKELQPIAQEVIKRATELVDQYYSKLKTDTPREELIGAVVEMIFEDTIDIFNTEVEEHLTPHNGDSE